MKKIGIVAPLIIGEACAIIFLLVSRFLELPDLIDKIAIAFPIILPICFLTGVFVALFASKKMPTIFQMAKSFLVGILNTFVDLGVLNLLMWGFSVSSGWFYAVFKAVSFGVSVLNSYFWNKFWTFSSFAKISEDGKKKQETAKAEEIAKFYGVALGGLLIHLVISSLVVNVIKPQFGLSPQLWGNVGGVAAALAGFLWNFFGYKLLVFKK